MTTEPNPRNGIARRAVLKGSAGTAGAFALSGCANAIVAQEDEYEDELPEDIEEFRIPQLNLDTLEAEFEGETLQAVSYEDGRPGSTTYIGEAAGRPGTFVAVSHLDETAEADEMNNDDEADGEDEQSDIVVYLCDGEVGTQGMFELWLTGDFDEDGMTLTNEDVDENSEVKLALVDGEFLGAATLSGEEKPVPFVASGATGGAGLYMAESEAYIVDDGPLSIWWVVLADGRQRGPDRHGPYRNTRY
jgi:hypothetical protein